MRSSLISWVMLLALFAVGELFAATPLPEIEPPAGEEAPLLPPVKTVKLSSRRDRLILIDGKTVEGSIVASGSQSVVIITADGEQTIPREQVQSIERAQVAIDGLEHRVFEMEVVDGREKVIVPPGLDAEILDGPMGIIPPDAGRRTSASLAYKLKSGDLLTADLAVTTTELEDLPGKERTRMEEAIRMQMAAKAARREAGGAWLLDVRFKLNSRVRNNAEITALEAKAFEQVNLLRSLSASGRWQPGADRVSGVQKTDDRFGRWLTYLTLPLPARTATFGEEIPLETVAPIAMAHQMLPPPDGVATERWAVTGTYRVSGTAMVAGMNCAIVVIDLKGLGAGTMLVDNRPERVDVQASARWNANFAIEDGRPVNASVESTSVLVAHDPKLALKRVTETKATLSVALESGQAPAAVKPEPEPHNPEVPRADRTLDEALDELMKQDPFPKAPEHPPDKP